MGIGNGFRGDDSVGILVLDRVMENVRDLREDQIIPVRLDGDQSIALDLMRSVEAVIIVDAARSNVPAGTIFRIDAGDRPVPGGIKFSSTHGYDIGYLIELARALKTLPKHVIIYGIATNNFGHGSNLTAEVRESIDAVVMKILKDIELLQKSWLSVH